MRKTTWASAALMLTFSTSAAAQVVFTEIQPNFPGDDAGEWFEIQNLGTSSVSLAGWSVADFSGGRLNSARWVFPATSSIAAGQVVVVTVQNTRFSAVFTARDADYEIDTNVDDPAVPNLVRTSTGTMMTPFQLGNNGDGILLRNAQNMIVDAIEYGNADIAIVPGLPFPNVPNPTEMNNISITRVMRTGSSAVDYSDRFTASPGVGFMTVSGPQITNVRARPRHAIYGQMYTITASITSAEPLRDVEVYFTTATSSVGPASGEYVAAELVATSSTSYSYSAEIQTFATGRNFGMPATFHDVYVRWFVRASDAIGNVTTEPTMAIIDANNARYLPAYVQNVLPATPTPIAQAREEDAAPRMGPRYRNHSVRVQGVALVGPNVVQPGRLQFAIQDASGQAIAVFDNNADVTQFTFMPGDVLEVTGTLNDFRGLTQIGSNVRIVSAGMTAPVPTSTRTIAQILAMGNALESQLVTILDANFVGAPPAMWPSDAMNLGSWNVRITDGTGEITLRVTPGAVGLFGSAAPQFGFDVTGVLAERDGQWQVFPRSPGDITAKPMPEVPDAGVSMGDGGNAGNPDAASGGRADASTGSRADSGTAVVPQPEEDSGCGCATTPGRGPSAEFVLGLALVVGLMIRRRRS